MSQQSSRRKSGSPRKSQNVNEISKYPCGHCERKKKSQWNVTFAKNGITLHARV